MRFILEQPRYFTNLSEVNSSLAPKEWRGIEDSLIAYHDFATGEFNETGKLSIVPESYKEEAMAENLTVSFAVNLDELRRSYEVIYVQAANGNQGQTTINCPRYIYNAYPEQTCVGMQNDSASLGLYLPQSMVMDDGEEIEVGAGWRSGEQAVVVKVNSCGAQSEINAAVREAKKLLQSMSLNPEEYDFITPLSYHNC